jgi:hypothetical protein
MPTSQQRREELSEMAAAVSPAPIGYEQSDQCWEIACLDGDNRLDWKNEIAMVVSSEEDTKYIVAMWNSTPALLADLTAVERERDEQTLQLNRALDFIERQGYRRCDCPACNCGSWHGGNASERLRELTEAMNNAGCQPMRKTLLVAVTDLIAKRDELREACRFALGYFESNYHLEHPNVTTMRKALTPPTNAPNPESE